MITLEDQIRRYAADVAGPAVAEAPADLLAVGRPHHRGRLVLVAALVVFIAGLTWVATRPADPSTPPAVDSLPTETGIPDDAVSQAGPLRPCAEGTPTGVQLQGASGDGLCVVAQHQDRGPDAHPETDALVAMVYVDGRPLGATLVLACGLQPLDRAPWFGTLSGPDTTVFFAQVPPGTATARPLDGDGPAIAAFDLPGVEGARFVLAHAADQNWSSEPAIYDAAGQRILMTATESTQCAPLVP